MNPEQNNRLYRWMRALHRDIGFFVLSLVVVYAFSGMVMTFRDTNFLKRSQLVEKTIRPGLSGGELAGALRMKKLKILAEDGETVSFENGSYNRATGFVSYTSMEYPAWLRALNDLHKTPSAKGRHWLTLLFACCLLFLAVSAFWMYRPKSGAFWRGMGFFALGLLCARFLLML